MPSAIRVLVDEGTVAPAGYREPARREAHAVLERRWFHWKFVLRACFCVVWFSFLALVFHQRLEKGAVPWQASLHVAVGLVFAYHTVAGFVNRTRISIERGMLTIAHGPLPWFGGRRIPLAEISQLFCSERVVKNERTYRLEAITREGNVTLLSGIPEPDQALYLEQALEERMGITNQPVPGELQPPA